MVNLLNGPNGSGKTQQMISLANAKVKTCIGNVVFIKQSHRDTSSVDFNIRTICMSDFPEIKNIDGYMGFLYGMYSCNTDTSFIYIDGVTKQADISMENFPELVKRLEKLSKDCNIEFYVSISATCEELDALISDDCQYLDIEEVSVC